MAYKLSRREFIKLGAFAGLTIGVSLGGCQKKSRSSSPQSFEPDVWIRVDIDNTITVTVAESEMGQGVMTTLPMMVAEEMEADWKQMRAVHADADRRYGFQQTGGSTSLRNNWKPLRLAGAAAREILVQAAARHWAIKPADCFAESGAVVNRISHARLSFGDLVESTEDIALPEKVSLKSPDQFRLIGKPLPRLDTPAKVNGSAVYGSDVEVEGLLTATVIHPPVFGGRVKTVNSKSARSISGVRHVVEVGSGVAIVADDFWAASQGADALEIEWDHGPNANLSSASIRSTLDTALNGKMLTERNQGNAQAVISSSPARIDAEFEFPFQAHATMEPMTCTADARDGRCELWAPTQAPTRTYEIAAALTQSAARRLYYRVLKTNDPDTRIHTTMLGGGFGRRLQTDFITEAIQISRSVNAPIRLIWSREEDIQHDYYRPATLHRISATLDDKGMPVAWWHRAAGPDLGLSGANAMPYNIANVKVDGARVALPIPTGPWRSVSHSYNAYVIESFIDQLARTAGQDPLEYRLKLLSGDAQYIHVLNLAAEKAGWGGPLPDGHYHGVAVYKSFGTYVAQIAEVSASRRSGIKVHKIVAAIDCGQVVNPDNVTAQMEGAIAFGLSAALKGEITIKNGRVEQSNFHDFPILQIDEMPEVETIIVNSAKSPEGVGEPGVPSIGPAVANAVFAATGKRFYSLPLRLV